MTKTALELSDADFDYLKIYYKLSYNSQAMGCIEVQKGFGGSLNFISTTATTNVCIRTRNLNINAANNKIYTVDDCYEQITGQTRYTQNNYLIPYKIYGCKYCSIN